MKTILEAKQALRSAAKQRRQNLPHNRRKEAARDVADKLAPLFQPHQAILSYASFEDELDTRTLNQHLSERGLLVLPRIEADSLRLYRVEDISQLQPNAWGILEPISTSCQEIAPSCISLAFIPGLAFDPQYHRLGYGKGYYDRLLPMLDGKAFGLGFREQYLSHHLPIFQSDVPLSALVLI